jgi:fucose permease
VTRAPGAGLFLVGLAYLAFVSLGLPDGLLGVAWPSIRASFGLPVDALGALLVSFTGGYLAASFGSGAVLRRMNVGTLLAASCLATGLSLLGYAVSPQWGLMVALALLAGLGAGAIDAGLNTYAAVHFSPRTVNWLHGFYGVGATLGPIVMTTVLSAGRPWQWGYAIVGAAQLLLAAGFAATAKSWSHEAAEAKSRAHGAAPWTGTLRLPAAWLGIALFMAYTGLEAAAGMWAYSLFTEARGVPAATAGVWVGIYFGSFTAGRFASGVIAGFVRPEILLRASLLGAVLCALAIWADVFTLVALGLLGFCLAPVFPSLIATTPSRLGEAHTANAVGFQIAAAVLGQSLIPATIGLIAARAGLEAIGPSLFAVAVLLVLLFEALAMSRSRTSAKP